eukprot:1274345-Lingulodinium_polyedra.AAC.1
MSSAEQGRSIVVAGVWGVVLLLACVFAGVAPRVEPVFACFFICFGAAMLIMASAMHVAILAVVCVRR